VTFFDLRHEANNLLELRFGGLEIVIRGGRGACAIGRLGFFVDANL
jgi:hypothetical protein